MPGSITSAQLQPTVQFHQSCGGMSSSAARDLSNIRNGDGVNDVSRVSRWPSGSRPTRASGLLDIVAGTFDQRRPETMSLRHGSGVVVGHCCLKPVTLNDGSHADAHASGLHHALLVGAGRNEQKVSEIIAKRPTLANHQAGVDLTTVGFVLQVAEREGLDISAVGSALEKTFKKLGSDNLAENSLGTYDGTRASKDLLDALKALRKETDNLVKTMGGYEPVLRGVAELQVHDRLLQNLHEEFPEFFDENGAWSGPDDGKGGSFPPDYFVNRYAADMVQSRSDVLDSAEPFAQLQGRVQELLKLSTLINERETDPPPPPAHNTPFNPGGPGQGPGKDGNWNWNGGARATGGTVTVSPGAFQSSVNTGDAVALKAVELLGEANERIAGLFSKYLGNVSNRTATPSDSPHQKSVASGDDDSGIDDDTSSISAADADLMRRLNDLRYVGDNDVDQGRENPAGGDDDVINGSPVLRKTSLDRSLTYEEIKASSDRNVRTVGAFDAQTIVSHDSYDSAVAIDLPYYMPLRSNFNSVQFNRTDLPVDKGAEDVQSLRQDQVKDGFGKVKGRWVRVERDGEGYKEAKTHGRFVFTEAGAITSPLDRLTPPSGNAGSSANNLRAGSSTASRQVRVDTRPLPPNVNNASIPRDSGFLSQPLSRTGAANPGLLVQGIASSNVEGDTLARLHKPGPSSSAVEAQQKKWGTVAPPKCLIATFGRGTAVLDPAVRNEPRREKTSSSTQSSGAE